MDNWYMTLEDALDENGKPLGVRAELYDDSYLMDDYKSFNKDDAKSFEFACEYYFDSYEEAINKMDEIKESY